MNVTRPPITVTPPLGPSKASSSTLMSVSVLSPDERPSLLLLDVTLAAFVVVVIVEEVAGDSVSSRDEIGVALHREGKERVQGSVCERGHSSCTINCFFDAGL